jgi:hypothetical protein
MSAPHAAPACAVGATRAASAPDVATVAEQGVRGYAMKPGMGLRRLEHFRNRARSARSTGSAARPHSTIAWRN